MLSRLLSATAFLLMLSGCGAAAWSTVGARAPHDLACAPGDVSVEDLGGGSFVAEGCGQRARYTCEETHDGMVDLSANRTTCTRE